MRSGEFDAIIDFQGEGVDDPSIVFARNVSADVSSYNPSGFIDRRLDELYDRIDSEFDPIVRKALVREFERDFLSETPYASPYWPGVALRVEESGPPVALRVLGGLGAADL